MAGKPEQKKELSKDTGKHAGKDSWGDKDTADTWDNKGAADSRARAVHLEANDGAVTNADKAGEADSKDQWAALAAVGVVAVVGAVLVVAGIHMARTVT